MSMFEVARNLSRGVKVAVLVTVAVLAVAGVGIFGFGWLQRTTAPFRGGTEQIEQIQGNGSYRIAQYDHFFDLCAAVQSSEASIDNLIAERDAGTTTQRDTIIQASITALRNSRATLIAQYNADARKADTAGSFRSSDLPYQLSPEVEHTSCTA